MRLVLLVYLALHIFDLRACVGMCVQFVQFASLARVRPEICNICNIKPEHTTALNPQRIDIEDGRHHSSIALL